MVKRVGLWFPKYRSQEIKIPITHRVHDVDVTRWQLCAGDRRAESADDHEVDAVAYQVKGARVDPRSASPRVNEMQSS